MTTGPSTGSFASSWRQLETRADPRRACDAAIQVSRKRGQYRASTGRSSQAHRGPGSPPAVVASSDHESSKRHVVLCSGPEKDRATRTGPDALRSRSVALRPHDTDTH